MKRFEATTIAKKTVTKLKSKPAESAIIEKLGGGDMTKGSCASLGLAYVGNKNGLNVTDYRGGESQQFFSYKYNLDKIMEILPGESVKREIARSWGTAGKHLLTQAEEGKEYYFCCGRHAAIIRRKDDKLQYLELQSAYDNGWKDFDGNVKYTLAQRFGCRGSQGRDVDAFMVDVDAFNDNEEFKDILEHLNTAEDEQKKGKGGYER